MLPRTYIPRTRVWERLDESTQYPGVTLLVAPAGAGKTLGVAGWLLRHRDPRGAVWLSRAGDLSPQQLRRATERPADGSAPPLVVIDDAHELSPACVNWLDDRLQHDPEGISLLLLSRWDLPLTRLVPELLGHLTILRGALLRLDPSETAQLVSAHVGDASEELIETIAAQGQGWCAAVVLTARTAAMSPDPLTSVRTARTSSNAVDRVAREAFAALSPRQRHVLLCVADEDAVSATLARHLSNDPIADRVLEELEDTGLLVTRQVTATSPLPAQPIEDPADGLGLDEGQQVTYRVHPLLAEVARRRMHAGGVDVERARSTVGRAVDLDVGRGHLADSLRRLLAVSDHERVVRLLISHGVPLVLTGDARSVRAFAAHHADLVEDASACWFPIALERWQAGCEESARYWLHRVTGRDRSKGSEEHGPASARDATCAHVMLALLGDEPLAGAAAEARELLAATTEYGNGRWPDVALLQMLLGMAQLRFGDLEAAAQNLGAVALHAGPLAAQALRVDALSQLAVSEFLRGREHVVLELASSLPTVPPTAATADAGLRVTAELSRLQMVADPGPVATRGGDTFVRVHPADAPGQVLALMLESRRFLMRGLAADAARVLDAGIDTAALPDSLRVPVLVEQALHAMLSLDRTRLRSLQTELTEAGAPGEAAFVAGLSADIADDLPSAITHFTFAAEHSACQQPAVAALASTCKAQLLDVMGRSEEALAALERALVDTAVRRNAVPFLGWSRHGTPVTRLLSNLASDRRTRWAEELARTTAGRPSGITGLAGPVTATPQERERVTTGGLRMDLSPRERDVLHELARGSTYSGIAANLFVSENTVKTHVSSLYAKLGVARRSEALAVARTLRML
ncbi:MAG TPA: LuxR C-terminal-related transcriptional regulator [Marmoricola sp.]